MGSETGAFSLPAEYLPSKRLSFARE